MNNAESFFPAAPETGGVCFFPVSPETGGAFYPTLPAEESSEMDKEV